MTDAQKYRHTVEVGIGPVTLVVGRDDRWTIEERMAHYGVPGLSVAVIREGRIDWSAAYGVMSAKSAARVSESTLFQAASMSKPATAVAVMRQVDAGRIDLDEDVSQYLKRWTIPQSSVRGAQSITLRQLLSHLAGTSVAGFPGYARDAALPSIVQVLNGAPPANTDPVTVIEPPGAQTRYSGGGTSIVQCVLTDLCNAPFEDIMDQEVLGPFGMENSTFRQPLPAALEPAAASGHDMTGQMIPGGWHVYPEQAAAGLWTTARDYARLMTGLQRCHGGHPGPLSRQATTAMMTRQPGGEYGLGWRIYGSPGQRFFQHGGVNAGFQCEAYAAVSDGYGAVVLTNADTGTLLCEEITFTIARTYDWPGLARPAKKPITVPETTLQSYVGRYHLNRPEIGNGVLSITHEGGQLYGCIEPSAPVPLLAEQDNRFFSPFNFYDLVFRHAEDDNQVRVIVEQFGEIVLEGIRKG